MQIQFNKVDNIHKAKLNKSSEHYTEKQDNISKSDKNICKYNINIALIQHILYRYTYLLKLD